MRERRERGEREKEREEREVLLWWLLFLP